MASHDMELCLQTVRHDATVCCENAPDLANDPGKSPKHHIAVSGFVVAVACMS